jgi:hypothetical protein
MFAGKTLFPSRIDRELFYAIETYSLADRDRCIRQAEDLCIVLADRRFRPALPKFFPGITGRQQINFIASWGIPRGDMRAIRNMLLPLVINELNLFPGSDLSEVIRRIFQTAENLCEHGIETTDANGQAIRLGGFLRDATERKVCLGAILGSGQSRVVLDDFSEDTWSFQTAPIDGPEDAPRQRRGMQFFHALAAGGNISDAIVAAGLLSAGTRDLFRGAAALKKRLSSPKRSTSTRRKKTRVRRIPQ